MDGPHALGTIILGESHPAASGKTVPTVGASFTPDVDGVGGGAACTESVAGCQIALVPDCQDSCDADQYCGFDAGCKPTCQAICDEQCGAGEVCYFPAPNTSARPSESSFGLVCMKSVPVNSFSNFSKPAPLAPLAWTVAALPVVFGAGPLPVKWTPGTGEVTITATVQSPDFKFGTITCKADDASGSFDVPREALKAAIDGEEIGNLTLSVQRQQTVLYKDLTTKGELTGVMVQPVGYLQIITSSTEFHAFQGCNPGEAVCGAECVDVQFDNDNCGGCNKACDPDQSCESGSCLGGGGGDYGMCGWNGSEGYYACADDGGVSGVEVVVAELGALGEQGRGGQSAAEARRADGEGLERREGEVRVVEDHVGRLAVAVEQGLQRLQGAEAGEVEDVDLTLGGEGDQLGAQAAGVVSGLAGQVGVRGGEQDEKAESGGSPGLELGERALEGVVVAQVGDRGGGPDGGCGRRRHGVRRARRCSALRGHGRR